MQALMCSVFLIIYKLAVTKVILVHIVNNYKVITALFRMKVHLHIICFKYEMHAKYYMKIPKVFLMSTFINDLVL